MEGNGEGEWKGTGRGGREGMRRGVEGSEEGRQRRGEVYSAGVSPTVTYLVARPSARLAATVMAP